MNASTIENPTNIPLILIDRKLVGKLSTKNIGYILSYDREETDKISTENLNKLS